MDIEMEQILNDYKSQRINIQEAKRLMRELFLVYDEN